MCENYSIIELEKDISPKKSGRGKEVRTMFVVHTVNQLEEAVRLGAEEILVTGGLASNVQDVYTLKSCRNSDSCVSEAMSEEGAGKIERIAEKSGVPAWRISSIIMITGDYILVDAEHDAKSPAMILQKTVHH